METPCISCNESILQIANFCHKCGGQQKCKACSTVIVKGANNCFNCGIVLSDTLNLASNAMNTVEFKQTADTREFKIALTDKVGGNAVGEILKNMIGHQIEKQHLKLSDEGTQSQHSITDNDNGTSDASTEDITLKDNSSTSKVVENNEVPHINDVEKTIECSEPEWILIYAFYNCNHGKDAFSPDAVYKSYKEKRFTESRMKNFSTNWKSLFRESIKTIKDGEMRLTQGGIDMATGLINKKITSKSKSFAKRATSKTVSTKKAKEQEPLKKSSAKSTKTSAKSITPEQFDLHKSSTKPSLEDFLRTKKVGDDTSLRILAIAYYTNKFCKLSSFSDGNIEYAYKVLGLNKRPKHLHQTILNAKIRHLWFEIGSETGNWKLTRDGEIYVDEKLV
ncbi:MAG: zinc ribbon domain-containing protein [Bacteroidota bacterium]